MRRVLPAPLLIQRCALLLCSTPPLRVRHSLKMYNGLVERCFMSCVDTFRRKTLEKNEEVVRVPTRVACLLRLRDSRFGDFLSAAIAGLAAAVRLSPA